MRRRRSCSAPTNNSTPPASNSGEPHLGKPEQLAKGGGPPVDLLTGSSTNNNVANSGI